jgi:P pilus assembly chaperone PapD
MKKAMAALTLCMAMMLCAGIAGAAGSSLEIQPLTIELQVEPGRAYTNTISLKNTGSAPEHVKAYCQDWAMKPDGLVVFVDAGKLTQSASPWVTLSPTDFDLAPGDTVQVRYTIRPPADAKGEFRTVIIFEGSAQAMTLHGGASRVIPRLGSVVYVQCGPIPQPQARITQFVVTADGGLLVVENTGPAHLRFTGRLEIGQSGQIVRSLDLTGFVVLPSPFNRHQVRIAKESLADLVPGEYELTAILDCGGPALLGARTSLALAPAKAK